MSTDLSTEADFTECTTNAAAKRHYTFRSWPRLTLCGNLVRIGSEFPSELPLCKQCEKSRRRQIEGRPH